MPSSVYTVVHLHKFGPGDTVELRPDVGSITMRNFWPGRWEVTSVLAVADDVIYHLTEVIDGSTAVAREENEHSRFADESFQLAAMP